LVVVSLLLPLGCARTGSRKTGSVTIGVVLPLTGEAAYIGEMVKSGMELAFEDMSEELAQREIDLTVVYEDSGNQPKNAVSAYQKLTAVDGADVVVCVSGGWKALVPLAERDEILLFCTVVSASEVATQSPWVFRFFLSADEDASLMARFAGSRLDAKRAAVLYVNDEFGASYRDVFSRTFEERGGEVVASEAFPLDASDFRTILGKLAAAEPDVIYLLAYGNNMALVPIQMQELGIDVQLLSLGTIGQPHIMAQAGESVVGAYYASTEFSTQAPNTPELRSFVEEYERQYGQTPVFFEVFGYDTAGLLMEAMSSGLESCSIREGLLNIKSYPGAVGEVTFSEEGEATFPMRVYQIVSEGTIAPVDFP